jgi:hypothetical protein
MNASRILSTPSFCAHGTRSNVRPSHTLKYRHLLCSQVSTLHLSLASPRDQESVEESPDTSNTSLADRMFYAVHPPELLMHPTGLR